MGETIGLWTGVLIAVVAFAAGWIIAYAPAWTPTVVRDSWFGVTVPGALKRCGALRLEWNGRKRETWIVCYGSDTVGMVHRSHDDDLSSFGKPRYLVAGVPGWTFPTLTDAIHAAISLYWHREDRERNDNIPLMYGLKSVFADLGGEEYAPREKWIFG
jgi:hypothetical protein